MRSVALFLDAGYLYAEVSRTKFGRPLPRHELHCNAENLVGALTEALLDAFQDSAETVRLLRVYWYDAAPRGTPTDEHVRIGGLRNVKVRLGRVTEHGQKGVDGLLILDMVTLGQERAIDTAFLLSGDEDLREAVLAIQQMGVRVVLLGIPPIYGEANQAESLIREADDHVVLERQFWTPFLHRIGSPALARHGDSEPPAPDEDGLAAAVTSYVEHWWATATPEDRAGLMMNRPTIPRELDRRLLAHVEKELGLDLRSAGQGVRVSVRSRFWEVVGRQAAAQQS